ncbi:MAG TPA: LysM peptidoglycan-binding domain-containing protein [Bacillota bacterium]|nr:LysM peptidoglycan-binding domain-containing protein [Bacillota bacterium]
MQRYLVLCGVLLTSALAQLASAQPTSPLVAEAQRQEAEERYRNLNARVQDLEAALQAYQQKFVTMAEEINQLRHELARVKDAANRDDGAEERYKHLAEKIQEVDRNRRSDNEKVLLEFEKIRKALLDRPSPPRARAPESSPTPPASNNGGAEKEKGYEYAIQKNDSLSLIVTKLNRQGIKLTSKQIIDANPGVKWNSLRIGQKIFIPAP